MKKSLRVYLEEAEKEYHFRVKTILDIGDKTDILERVLRKYDLKDMGQPRKTIVQEHPLDFQDISNAEVWIVDVVLGIPTSFYILEQELRRELGIPEKYIVVKTDNDPLEIETQRINAANEAEKEAEEKGLQKKSLLSVMSEYPEYEESKKSGEELYGDEYNKSFLSDLAKIASERKSEKYNAPSGLTDWEDMVEEYPFTGPDDDFNFEFKDVPQPVKRWDVTAGSPDDDMVDGHFDEDDEEMSFAFKDPDSGSETIIVKKNEPIRG